jgi:hypothetical protein
LSASEAPTRRQFCTQRLIEESPSQTKALQAQMQPRSWKRSPYKLRVAAKRTTDLLNDPGQQVQPPYGMIGIHPSRVIEFAGNPLPDWRLATMGGGWGDRVQTLHRMMEAIVRGWTCGGALIVLPASAPRMGFRVPS